MLVHTPNVFKVSICWFVPTGHVARAVRQRLLASTMHTKDGSRRNKRRKDWCRRCRGTEGTINILRAFVVGAWNVLHNPLYVHLFASFRLLGSPYQVLQCSTHYLRAVKDPKTSKTSRLSTRSFRQRFVADTNVYRQQIRVCVALIDAIKSALIANYCERTLIMDRCGKYHNWYIYSTSSEPACI